MPTISQTPLSGRYLSFAEREEIAILHVRDCGVREIARRLGRDASTIFCELRRNAATRGGRLEYRATNAQWHADRRARCPKVAKLAAHDPLHRYVQQRLSGAVTRPDGAPVEWSDHAGSAAGTAAARTGAGQPVEHGADRPAACDRLSRCAAYRRTGRAVRVPRARTRRGKGCITDEVMISERPAEVDDRAVPGHR